MIPFVPPPGTGAVGAATAADAEGYIDVMACDELPPGSQKSIAQGFQRVLMCHTPDGIHAVADCCPHALQPLLGSEISGGVIRCARHGATFELASGRPQNGVTRQPLRVYPVRIRDGRIQIGVGVSGRRV